MNWTLLIGLVSAGAWTTGIWALVDGIRKRRAAKEHAADEGDRMVVQSAMDLLKPYREEVTQLKADLVAAKGTIDNLTGQLALANQSAADLAEQLGDAQAEIRLLRAQVKTMTQQLGGDPA